MKALPSRIVLKHKIVEIYLYIFFPVLSVASLALILVAIFYNTDKNESPVACILGCVTGATLLFGCIFIAYRAIRIIRWDNDLIKCINTNASEVLSSQIIRSKNNELVDIFLFIEEMNARQLLSEVWKVLLERGLVESSYSDNVDLFLADGAHETVRYNEVMLSRKFIFLKSVYWESPSKVIPLEKIVSAKIIQGRNPVRAYVKEDMIKIRYKWKVGIREITIASNIREDELGVRNYHVEYVKHNTFDVDKWLQAFSSLGIDVEDKRKERPGLF